MEHKKPSHTQIKLFESILLLEAYIETIRPEITKIYNDVLFYMIPKHIAVCKRTGEPITDYSKLYRVADSEYIEKYYHEVRTVLWESKKFRPTKFEFCHLLESESLLRDLNYQFAKACIEELPGTVLQGKTREEFLKSLNYSLKYYEKFLDINKRWVIGFIDKTNITKIRD